MKKLMVAAVALVVLGGCSTVHDYYPGSQVVTVDGTEYMVRQIQSSTGNSWMATSNRPTGKSLLLIDPAIYAGNVKAIAQASGCPVAEGSAQNENNTTIAAVDCSGVVTPQTSPGKPPAS